MAARPSSGSSARSRRDEVWEMKRQRFIARKHAEQAVGSGVGYSGGAGARNRPPALDHQSLGREPTDAPPGSPLSQFVAQGYREPQQVPTLHQPYGERPSSGSGFGHMQQGPSSRGSRHSQQSYHSAFAGGNGFDAGVAGQWSSNVQQNQYNQQSRHDPNISGPAVPSGGQRVTQAPGGGSKIDLSWGGHAAQPPRMPGPPSTSSIGSSRHPAPSYEARGPSPNRGSQGGFAAPFGREDDNLPLRQTPVRHASCPFGTDDAVAARPVPQAAMRSGSRGPPMAAAPHPVPQAAMRSGSRGAPMVGHFGGEAPAAGVSTHAGRGPGGRHAPGGVSQVVLG